MLYYIIIGITLIMLIGSLITVIPERLLRRNSAIGKVFRFIRIRLREISRTSFCVISIVTLLLGLIFHGNIKMLLIAVGIMLLTLVILHPEDIIFMFRTRKKAVRKHEIPLTAKAPLFRSRTPEAALCRELTPLAAEKDTAEN